MKGSGFAGLGWYSAMIFAYSTTTGSKCPRKVSREVDPRRDPRRAPHLPVDVPAPVPHPLDVLVQGPRVHCHLQRVLVAAHAEAVQDPGRRDRHGARAHREQGLEAVVRHEPLEERGAAGGRRARWVVARDEEVVQRGAVGVGVRGDACGARRGLDRREVVGDVVPFDDWRFRVGGFVQVEGSHGLLGVGVKEVHGAAGVQPLVLWQEKEAEVNCVWCHVCDDTYRQISYVILMVHIY
jgi:hypothetical protein